MTITIIAFTNERPNRIVKQAIIQNDERMADAVFDVWEAEGFKVLKNRAL